MAGIDIFYMIRKCLIIAILYSFFTMLFLKTAWGQEQIAGESAQIEATASSKPTTKPKFDFRPLKLRNFLAHKNSLLEKYSFTIVKIADKNQLDYRLFPAIAGVESGFCQAYIVSTNNCVGWGGGYIPFSSIEEQIKTIITALKNNYINDGLLTVDQIGSRYAADPTWSFKVKKNMKEIEETNIL
jgi:hypothetical protein